MRARSVNENVNFERGQNPKEAMGIGPYSQTKFDSFDEAVDFAYRYFPAITGYEDDSVFGEDTFFTADALTKLVPFLSNMEIGSHKSMSYAKFPGALYRKLKEEGFPRVNENVNFERTGNPKAGMDIGGTKLSYIRKEISDQAKENWNQWIHDYIVGNSITGYFNRIAKEIEDGFEFTGEGWGDYTVKVKELVNSGEIQMDNTALFIIGEDGYQYVVPIDDKKIWIKP